MVVNFPVLIIIFVVSALGILFTAFIDMIISTLPGWFFPAGVGISVIMGSLVAWFWWSFSVPRWRKWALENGAPEDKLQKWGVITGLVWPKGSIFEKTEFKVKD